MGLLDLLDDEDLKVDATPTPAGGSLLDLLDDDERREALGAPTRAPQAAPRGSILELLDPADLEPQTPPSAPPPVQVSSANLPGAAGARPPLGKSLVPHQRNPEPVSPIGQQRQDAVEKATKERMQAAGIGPVNRTMETAATFAKGTVEPLEGIGRFALHLAGATPENAAFLRTVHAPELSAPDPLPAADSPEGTLFGDVSDKPLLSSAIDAAETLFGTPRIGQTATDAAAAAGDTKAGLTKSIATLASLTLQTIATMGAGGAGRTAAGGASIADDIARLSETLRGRLALGAATGAAGQARAQGIEDPEANVTSALAGAGGGALGTLGLAGGIVGGAAYDALTGAAELARREPELAAKVAEKGWDGLEPGEKQRLLTEAVLAVAPGILGEASVAAARATNARTLAKSPIVEQPAIAMVDPIEAARSSAVVDALKADALSRGVSADRLLAIEDDLLLDPQGAPNRAEHSRRIELLLQREITRTEQDRNRADAAEAKARTAEEKAALREAEKAIRARRDEIIAQARQADIPTTDELTGKARPTVDIARDLDTYNDLGLKAGDVPPSSKQLLDLLRRHGGIRYYRKRHGGLEFGEWANVLDSLNVARFSKRTFRTTETNRFRRAEDFGIQETDRLDSVSQRMTDPRDIADELWAEYESSGFLPPLTDPEQRAQYALDLYAQIARGEYEEPSAVVSRLIAAEQARQAEIAARPTLADDVVANIEGDDARPVVFGDSLRVGDTITTLASDGRPETWEVAGRNPRSGELFLESNRNRAAFLQADEAVALASEDPRFRQAAAEMGAQLFLEDPLPTRPALDPQQRRRIETAANREEAIRAIREAGLPIPKIKPGPDYTRRLAQAAIAAAEGRTVEDPGAKARRQKERQQAAADAHDTVKSGQLGTNHKAPDPLIESRLQAAYGEDPKQRVPILQRLRDAGAYIKQITTSPFYHLRTSLGGGREALDEKLRQFNSQVQTYAPARANHEYALALRPLTDGTDKKQRAADLELYQRSVLFQELAEYEAPRQLRLVERGDQDAVRLPYNLSPEAVRSTWQHYKRLVDANPRVKASLENRQRLFRIVGRELVALGLATPEQVSNPVYYTHTVVRSRIEEQAGLEATLPLFDIGPTGKPTFKQKDLKQLKSREGSVEAIRSDVVSVDLGTLETLMREMERARLAKWLAQSPLNIAGRVREEAEAKGEASAWRSYIPEGYEVIRYSRGQLRTNGSLADELTRDIIAPEAAKVLGEELGLHPDVVLENLLGTGEVMVLPADVARQFRDLRSQAFLGTAAKPLAFTRKLTQLTKRALLFGPLRAISYSVGNAIGDSSSCLAYEPGVFRYMGEALADLRAAMSDGEWSSDFEASLRRGVLSSGIDDVEVARAGNPVFRRFQQLQLDQKATAEQVARKLWSLGFTPEVSALRDNLFRLACFKFYKAHPDRVGVSKPQHLAGITDPLDAAARKSRDLLLDYANPALATAFLRDSGLVPFSTWLAGNPMRAYRGFKNAATGPDKARIAAAQVLAMGARMALLPALQMLFGLLRPDALKDLNEYDQRRGALPLWQTEDGRRRYLRLRSDATDLAEWIGLFEMPRLFDDLNRGRDPKEVLKNWGQMPLTKAFLSLNPIGIAAAEHFTGRAYFPNPFEFRRNNRSADEQIADLAIGADLYRPIKDLWDPQPRHPDALKDMALSALLIKTADPQQSNLYAAYDAIEAWERRTGKPRNASLTRRESSSLIARWARARRLKDTRTEQRLIPLIENAVAAEAEFSSRPKSTAERLQAAQDNAHPFGYLSSRDTRAFVAAATPEERQVSLQALDYWESWAKPSANEKRKVQAIRRLLENPALARPDDASPLAPPIRLNSNRPALRL